MCRGCDFKIKEKSTCIEYLEIFERYQEVIAEMKSLEKDLLTYQQKLTSGTKWIDKFRRKAIKIRKSYGRLNNESI